MKYFITTLGCKVNQAESEAIAHILKDADSDQTRNEAEADICIINTCTVTGKASMQSRQAIRKAIKANPNARIVVTGCYAQTETDEIKKIKGVHYIIGQSSKSLIPELALSGEKHKNMSSPVLIRNEMGKEEPFNRIPVNVSGIRTRPFLKIQDGCNSFCTYCIVPYSRGRSRSMPLEEVLNNIKTLDKAGYKETVLTGIHLGCYGLDLTPETSLFKLLDRIDKSTTIERIRLSSIEPHELNNEIIELVAESDKICNHFHVPLQSGSDNILKRMNRPYTSNKFREMILKISKSIPDAAIGVDTLIGFPGETEKEFENTFSLIKELPVTYLHVFPFSPRKGTPAEKYSDRVDTRVVKARCKKMRELGIKKKRAFCEESIGKTHKVLLEEKRDDKTGLLKGITSNYISVLSDGPDCFKNTITDISIDRLIDNNSVSGTILMNS
ncbi:MAG: tRNA (N(6)-L-threonylcarbamoyladenosine(37)-C(2))-methylthiotransferase MtaB [Desulfobacterales bacterium]|jgi:threonylcarbamoyladenosine tRNA methylthiotransferase MtaB|nr:tRNA (N(6)-L-threonylcarbamoyladenosine(37)-C(2))-methylthiotransferase MtaB [Desulfobacteraceae bacterium]MBT7086314.1 tRNA (N(6)-L-threonylcarbamoyladenosine(37)-C(2))-methylthiotransferase MtaB [Desulfobacterales bacterium]MBT7696721.1 tRNA (N(6)-L-threonylcarbamoyladenosine(37)-C(2))-methylthiotransferase MtaB [Desulfobacterales bacterium]